VTSVYHHRQPGEALKLVARLNNLSDACIASPAQHIGREPREPLPWVPVHGSGSQHALLKALVVFQ